MFLSIYDNASGEEYLRRLAPSESLDLRQHVRKWARDAMEGARPVFSKWGAAIPNGCGDYQAEIRDTKRVTGSCWTCEPFYLEHEEY